MKSENFLSEFTFDNLKCNCAIEKIINEFDDTLNDVLKIKEDSNNKIKLSYQYGFGLKKIKESKRNNPLGEFLGIKKYDLNELKSYFEKYGFLYKLNNGKYNEINTGNVFLFQERIIAFINLINNQNTKLRGKDENTTKINIKNLLDSSLYLILKSYEIEDANYKLHNNSLFTKISNIIFNPEENSALYYEAKNERYLAYYKTKDSIYNNEYKISKEEFLRKINKESLFFKNIAIAFLLKDNLDLTKNEKLKLDFMYHFLYNFIIINPNEIYVGDSNIFYNDIYNEFEKDECMVNGLIEISKILISEEFERNLTDVTPTYDVIKMKPSWKLPSLIDAFYFSIYYRDSSELNYRKCKNNKCGLYFEVSKTNSKKLFCDTLCTNAYHQRKHKKEKNKGIS